MEKKRTGGSGPMAWAICIWIVIMLPGSVPQAGAQTSVSDDIEKPVKQAIDTRQATQAAQEKWDGERSKLIAQYDRLKARNEQLTAVRDRLSTRADKLTAANRALEAEKAEAERIATEMHPHLSSVTDRINALIRTDAPFLHQERITRMTKLAAIVEDPEITVAEKYRKTMEALFIEAEYGNTVEVYQEKIRLDDSEVLGNIFRLGRVSLFFLSLDRANAAVFDVASGHWVRLGSDAVQAIAAVNAMAAKHRPMEVVSLPVGRLAPAKGGDHDEE